MTLRNYFGMVVLAATFYLVYQYFHANQALSLVPAAFFLSLAAVGGWLIDEAGFQGLVDGLKKLFSTTHP